jgi:hypothetical protein
MRRAIWVVAMGIALATGGPAAAGCMATVGLTPLPSGGAGETWTANVQVLQHGQTPMDDASPTVLISNAATGEERSFPATLVNGAEGRYRADVVFPASGSWSVAVNDGFPVSECAQTHTFGTFAIGAAAAPPPSPPEPEAPPAAQPAVVQPTAAAADDDGTSVVLPLALGLGLGAVVIAAVAIALRTRRVHARTTSAGVT